MKYSLGGFLLAIVPMCAFATTIWGLGLQAQECQDTRLYFKLLLWGPIVEELVFRAGLQKWLAQKLGRPYLANVLSSFMFALMHYALSGNLATLLVFLPSMLLGWVYQKTNSLMWAIVLHSIFNLMFVTITCRY